MQIRTYYATSMFVQESANTQTTKPGYTDRGLAGAANRASSQFYARTHASSLHTNEHNCSKTKYCTRSMSPPPTPCNSTTTFLLQSWNRHSSCRSNCCLAMTCSPSSPALFNSLLFSPPSRPYSNSKCQNVQISQGTSCLRLLGFYLKNKPRSQHFILHRSLIFIGSVEQQP